MDLLNDNKSLYKLVNEVSIQYFQKPFLHQVQFNHRLRTTGGRYIPAKKIIELNPKYLTEMDEHEFIGIVKHELCHYHLHIEGKGYKHGDAEFKNLLRATGSPRHCRPLPSNEDRYKYKYVCNNCKHVYKRARRINVNQYRCGKCNGRLSMLEG
ncbi:SprT family protein [Lentibacillus daqui]|uniref:SprT family protein n=1 Tax=Lentibacillus daqui TaxID=2911514 RepID=UPI0022B10274|nr:SprT family protein [Lentibacillus daqui]